MTFTACTKDAEANQQNPEQPEDSTTLEPQPTTDEIVTRFNGKTFFAGLNDELVDGYIKPRTTNIAADIADEQVRFILMSENFASEAINNENVFDLLQLAWNRHRAIGFVNPGDNAIILFNKLRNHDFNYSADIDPKMRDAFGKMKIFVTVAGIKNYVHEKYDEALTFYSNATTLLEDGTETEESNSEELTLEMNGYKLGVVAEDLCTWLNTKVSTEDGADPALVTRADDEYIYGYSETEWSKKLKATYNHVSSYNKNELAPRTITNKTIVQVTGGYYEKNGSDLYDVTLIDKFPISQLYNENVLLSQYGLFNYKDKYTGYCYTGPHYAIYLQDSSKTTMDSSKVSISGASPQIENGDLSTTHYPLNASFGSSLSGGVSAEGPNMSVGLSSNFTLPYDARTIAYKEMKFNYSEYNGTSKWEYYHDGYWIYNWTWGFNGKFDYVYGPAHNDSDYSFMATFELKDSRKYKEENLYLGTTASFHIYEEYCTPEKHTRYDSYWGDFNYTHLLPVVYRYFDHYEPSYYSATFAMNDDDWVNINEALMDNPTYKALCNEDMMVGARVEKTSDGKAGTQAQAERIWRETMQSIIKQRNGHSRVNGEVVIGLYSENSGWLKMGLHIKDNEWKIVEDVSVYDNLGLN